jgi:hypothetical protein
MQTQLCYKWRALHANGRVLGFGLYTYSRMSNPHFFCHNFHLIFISGNKMAQLLIICRLGFIFQLLATIFQAII